MNGEQIVMDGGEQLKGASEFRHLGDLLTEEPVADDEAEEERIGHATKFRADILTAIPTVTPTSSFVANWFATNRTTLFRTK